MSKRVMNRDWELKIPIGLLQGLTCHKRLELMAARRHTQAVGRGNSNKYLIEKMVCRERNGRDEDRSVIGLGRSLQRMKSEPIMKEGKLPTQTNSFIHP